MRINWCTKYCTCILYTICWVLDICGYLCNYHHDQGNEHIHHVQKFPQAPFWVLFVSVYVLKTHNMRSTFLKILSVQYNINYGYRVVQQMSRTYSSCITETLYSLTSISPFLLPPHSMPYDLVSEYLAKKIAIRIWRDTHVLMFTVAFSTVAKIWKQPKYPLMDAWIKTMWLMCTMEYYPAIVLLTLICF